MYSAEDLFTEDDVNNDLIPDDNDDNNSGNEQVENDAEDEPENDEVEKKVVKPKRVIRNPQPKLNVETLKGPKGLLCLEGYFKNKKYKGRGHEQEDLRTIMKTYEYWCHRLFPKFPFDDCLAKIESLGTKKPMQTYLKRIRTGLIFDDEQPIQSDKEENQAVDDQFDELVAQDFNSSSRTAEDDDQQLTEEQLERIKINKERADLLRRERLEKRKDALAEASQASESVKIEEQLERIRVNKERAELLRQERLKRNKQLSDIITEESHDNPGSLENTMQTELENQSSIEIINLSSAFDVVANNSLRDVHQKSELRTDRNLSSASDVIADESTKGANQENDLQSFDSQVLDIPEDNAIGDMDETQRERVFEETLPEVENNDLIKQSTCESATNRNQVSQKNIIRDETVQPDGDYEVSMDCSS